MPENTKQDDRVRNFATIVYPESAPEGWVEILSKKNIPCFISPLHDKDENADHTPKKAHYHIMLMFEGKKSPNTVRKICEEFGGVGIEAIDSKRGYARYLCHLDNPEKAQYEPENVKSFAGADYLHEIGTVLDRYRAIREMIAFCEDNCIISYARLLIYAMDERPDWFRVLCDNGTYVVKEYLKSKTWEANVSPENLHI